LRKNRLSRPTRRWGGWLLLGAVAGGLGSGCTAARSRGGQLYPDLVQHTGKQIDDVEFVSSAPFDKDTLLTVTRTQPSHCAVLGLPICVPFTRLGKKIFRFNVQQVFQDVLNLRQFYRYSGYFGTDVTPTVTEKGDEVVVTFTIRRGQPVVLDSLEVTGTEGILDPDSLERTLPLDTGQIFHLGHFNESADHVLRALQSRGHAYAQVLRNYGVDTLRDRATAALFAVPGPRVVVDSIVVVGAESLGRRGALRQLNFRKGDVLRTSRLVESQRNLYSLDLIQLASVTIAPDSLDATPQDSSRATVLVNIAESRVNLVDAILGYGTVECLRTEVDYVNRSFGGGARRLAVNGSVSKIGLGGATASGLGERLCSAFSRDTFENTLDFRLGADITQPYFLSPRNHLTLNLFVERQSEPTVFQRAAQGGRIQVSRRLATRTVLSGGFDIEHGKTVASAALFCSAFEICDPDTIERLSQPRWRNSLTLSFLRDRTDVSLDPSNGTVIRSGLAWAPPWLLSDITFLRGSAEIAAYREVRPGWILAGSYRIGNFFKTATLAPTNDFLPPEERFYAGGANTVRGYTRNAMGPGVWVTDTITMDTAGQRVPADEPRFVPLGGTGLAILNAELRMPSPILPRRLRLAVFLDAGAIGSGNVWELGPGDWHFTPGAGLRITTPVGPARVDFSYLPYGPTAGPLYHADGQTLTRVQDSYRFVQNDFFSRFRIHLAVGQAF
jgi:outer membrane protein assembly factor BamA